MPAGQNWSCHGCTDCCRDQFLVTLSAAEKQRIEQQGWTSADGVDPAAIAISAEGRTLTIRAERAPEERQNGTYQVRERAYGAFSRTLRLSDDLDVDGISAEARHGVLTVRIPKRAEAKPRQIAVTVS